MTGFVARVAAAVSTAGRLAATVVALVRDLVGRDRASLAVENAFLRQQLAVARRQVERARPSGLERLALSLLARLFDWRGRGALLLVTPATLIRWQRSLWRAAWSRRCSAARARPTSQRPTKVTPNVRELVLRMARDNPRWGALRIVGELRQVGVRLCKRTVQRILLEAGLGPERRGRGQSWRTFLRNHLDATWACDLLHVPVGLFGQAEVFFVLHLGTRRVVHWAVTTAATPDWLVQQARNATAWCNGPRLFVRDRDSRFTRAFDAVLQACGTRVLKTPPQQPVANAFAERLVGTLRRELLDHLVVLSEDHLRARLREFFAHYHEHRPRRGLELRVPANARDAPPPERPLTSLHDIVAVPQVGGLVVHFERRVA